MVDLSPIPAAAPGHRVQVPQGIADRLRTLIRHGDLKVGDRLPSQRHLAERLGVSRPSLREAISSLEGIGLLAVRVGSGVFVASPDPAPPPWRFAHRCSARDLYEARVGLEGFAARLAAAHRDDAGLDRLGTAVAAMAAALSRGDVAAMGEADALFHDHVLGIAANSVLAAMIGPMRDMIVESQRLPLAAHIRIDETLAEHRMILSRIAAGDPDGAERVMRCHIEAAAARYGIELR